MAGNSAERGRSVTSKIAAILTSFNSGSGLTQTDLAGRTGMPISTVHRLAGELARRHLLERTADGRYRVGLPLRMLSGARSEPPTVRERAPFVLDDLCDATRATVRFGVLDDGEVAYIERRPGHQPVTSFSSAARLPAHATALGKALLAFSTSSVVTMVLAQGLTAYTRSTLTTPDDLRRVLRRVRATRLAMSCGELTFSDCAVAMPVLGDCGRVVAAIEVEVLDLENRTLCQVLPALMLAARSLARELVVGERDDVQELIADGGSLPA